jgi:hypothetical protein
VPAPVPTPSTHVPMPAPIPAEGGSLRHDAKKGARSPALLCSAPADRRLLAWITQRSRLHLSPISPSLSLAPPSSPSLSLSPSVSPRALRCRLLATMSLLVRAAQPRSKKRQPRKAFFPASQLLSCALPVAFH